MEDGIVLQGRKEFVIYVTSQNYIIIFHYIFQCTEDSIQHYRNTLLPNYFCHHANIIKFDNLFNEKNLNKLLKLTKFIKIIIERVSSPG